MFRHDFAIGDIAESSIEKGLRVVVTAMIASRPDPDDEHPRSTDVLDTCIAALVSQRDVLRASAIVADVRLPVAGSDSIQVDLEHADGHALTVLLPYMNRRRRRIEYGELQAQLGRSQIWS